MADNQQPPATSLLDLPDACLLTVLRCCDQRSLFRAARAHSRLHQAAGAALSSITVRCIRKQQRVDGLLLSLAKHGQHVSSIKLNSDYTVTLRELPPNLRLRRLQLSGLNLQLQPWDDWQGVLGYAGVSALTQLQLERCVLLDGDEGLEAALQQLPPGLEHLRLLEVQLHDDSDEYPPEDLYGTGISGGNAYFDGTVRLPVSVLQRLQQLTCLHLSHMLLVGPDQLEGEALQELQALTRLADLRLALDDETVTVDLLSGMCRLTRLEVRELEVEPDALDGMTQLQHLMLHGCSGVQEEAGWVGQLLTWLQPLQQLTHLDCDFSLIRWRDATHTPPSAAYSALTASGSLRHLSIRGCTLPMGAWEHMFPAGRQLLRLTSLNLVGVQHPPQGVGAQPPAAAFDGSRLASCCPKLRSLQVYAEQCSAGAIAALQGLSELRTLLVFANHKHVPDPAEFVARQEVLCEVAQLTALRELKLDAATEWLLAQMTTLVQLKKLRYYTCKELRFHWLAKNVQLTAKAPDDEPVWRQLLRLYPAPPPAPSPPPITTRLIPLWRKRLLEP